MKIGYIMYPGACYIGKGDGIIMQAEIWRQELEKKGHIVDKISPWEIITGKNMISFMFLD